MKTKAGKSRILYKLNPLSCHTIYFFITFETQSRGEIGLHYKSNY
jgi:hypothetical protein